MTAGSRISAINGLLRRLCTDEKGANAIEFAILALPFLSLLMFVMQLGLFNFTKMSLDAGLLKEAEAIQAQFNQASGQTLPTGSALKASVASYASGVIGSGTPLSVEIQPLANLGAATVPITDQLANYGVANTVLVLRASYATPSFVPGVTTTFKVYSSTLIRRQNR